MLQKTYKTKIAKFELFLVINDGIFITQIFLPQFLIIPLNIKAQSSGVFKGINLELNLFN